MMRVFDWPWLAMGALVGAAAMYVLVRVAFQRRLARLERFGAHDLVMRLIPASATIRPSWRAARLAGVALFGLLALAGPRWGSETTVVRGEGIDVVLALDASLSMLAPDERPSRLERMKQEVRRFRARSRGDRFALLAFAGRSYILTPLTVDDGALELFLDNLDPSVVGQAGSSLARTLTQGIDLLQASRSAGDRALVLMTDGEAFDERNEILEAARRAREAGIVVVTVGFGTEQGSTIPVRDGSRVSMKRDENGEIVVTRYNPQILREIADAAGGTFIEAQESDKAARIRQSLQSLQGVGRSIESQRNQTPRFQLFVISALLLLFLDLWLSERRRRARHTTAVGTTPAAAAPLGATTAGTRTTGTRTAGTRTAGTRTAGTRTAGAATAAVLLALFLNGCALPGSAATRAARAYGRGDYARAAQEYRAVIADGDRRPEMLYNLGTAYVAADSHNLAAEPLERVARLDRAELRYRALFNLGLSQLEVGLAAPEGDESAGRAFSAAVDLYKRVLLMRPDDPDAKWNYELALRKKKQSGGGGGGGESEQQQNQSTEPQQREQPSGGLGQDQAEQLLNSAARDERGVQEKKQKAARPSTPPRGKDW